MVTTTPPATARFNRTTGWTVTHPACGFKRDLPLAGGEYAHGVAKAHRCSEDAEVAHAQSCELEPAHPIATCPALHTHAISAHTHTLPSTPGELAAAIGFTRYREAVDGWGEWWEIRGGDAVLLRFVPNPTPGERHELHAFTGGRTQLLAYTVTVDTSAPLEVLRGILGAAATEVRQRRLLAGERV